MDARGVVLDQTTVEWITAALELRISPRGNDGDEAVGIVLEIVRAYAEEQACSIVIQRRQATVESELEQTQKDRENTRREKKVSRLVRGLPISTSIYNRPGSRQEMP